MCGTSRKSIKKVEGVENAEVNLATEKAMISSSQPLDLIAVTKAVERAGYKILASQPIELSIEGMTCASCVGRVEKALKKVEGVQQANVNLATERAWVQGNAQVQSSDLIQAVKKAGYTAKQIEQSVSVQQDKSHGTATAETRFNDLFNFSHACFYSRNGITYDSSFSYVGHGQYRHATKLVDSICFDDAGSYLSRATFLSKRYSGIMAFCTGYEFIGRGWNTGGL